MTTRAQPIAEHSRKVKGPETKNKLGNKSGAKDSSQAVETEAEAETATETAIETDANTESETTTTESETGTEAAATATTAEPEPKVDRFSYDESIVTLAFNFLPPTEPEGERQVVVSVHSKNGKQPPVLPEFIPTFRESELGLHPAVEALLERYRTVILPQRKEIADAWEAEQIAKRAAPKSKDVRPAHVNVTRATRTAQQQNSNLLKSQLKLEL